MPSKKNIAQLSDLKNIFSKKLPLFTLQDIKGLMLLQ